MLEKLKSSGNPFYQDINSPANYRSFCKSIDISGYNLIYGNDDLIEDFDAMNPKNHMLTDEVIDSSTDSDSGDNDDGNESGDKDKEKKHVKKNNSNNGEEKGIKKHQFLYDEAVCMTDKYPEISVAPGEGQKPTGILSSKNWDIKAFPHLHNADGSNGKDAERKIKLTDQRYFIQRICNMETRFAKSPPYLYSAVGYLEEKQLYNNINLAGARGKKVTKADGSVSYQLDDEYRVLEKIKNTPGYWRTAKYEMLAKLDNFGPFHLFFTLSCADKRWETNFATILMERGYEIKFQGEQNEKEFEVKVEARQKGKEWKPLDQFLREDVEESLHELIRGNVVTTSRY